MPSKRRATALTFGFSILNVIVVAVIGLLFTQKVIEVYGSSVNGLISSLTQFVTLFTIIEGGYTTAAVVAMYEPAAALDYARMNDVLSAATRVFRLMGLAILLISFFAGLVYVHFLASPLEMWQTVSLLGVTAITAAASVGLQAKYTIALAGLNMQYVQTGVMTLGRLLCWVVSMVLISLACDIVYVYLVFSAYALLNLPFYRCWLRKNVPAITFKGTGEKRLVSGTRDVLLQKVANAVFTSTDLVLISAGIGLVEASVYYVYNQIYNAASRILESAASSPVNSFGHLLNEGDKTRFEESFSVYQVGNNILASIAFSTVGASVVGFVSIYMRNVVDADYLTSSLPILLYIQCYLTTCNRPFGTILNLTKNFSAQNAQCVVATIVNLVLSVVAMMQFGISGVVFGSIAGVFVILAVNVYQCFRLRLLNNRGAVLGSCLASFVSGLIVVLVANCALRLFPQDYLIWCGVFFLELLVSGVLAISLNALVLKRDFVRTLKLISRIWRPSITK